MKAVILAAGQGVRMKPLTDDKPKALVELKGKPLLQHVLESLQNAGVREAVIVIGFKGEEIEKRFGKKFGKMRLSYVWQRIAMGTAHALLQAKGKTGKRFFVDYCDVIVEPALWKKLAAKKGFAEGNFPKAFAKAKGFDAVIALRREQHPERFGVALVSGKKLEQIVEKPQGKIESDLVNVGAYLFTEKIFDALKKTKISQRGEFELTDSINALAAKGKAGFVVYEGKCLDIGTKDDLKKAAA